MASMAADTEALSSLRNQECEKFEEEVGTEVPEFFSRSFIELEFQGNRGFFFSTFFFGQ